MASRTQTTSCSRRPFNTSSYDPTRNRNTATSLTTIASSNRSTISILLLFRRLPSRNLHNLRSRFVGRSAPPFSLQIPHTPLKFYISRLPHLPPFHHLLSPPHLPHSALTSSSCSPYSSTFTTSAPISSTPTSPSSQLPFLIVLPSPPPKPSPPSWLSTPHAFLAPIHVIIGSRLRSPRSSLCLVWLWPSNYVCDGIMSSAREV